MRTTPRPQPGQSRRTKLLALLASVTLIGATFVTGASAADTDFSPAEQGKRAARQAIGAMVPAAGSSEPNTSAASGPAQSGPAQSNPTASDPAAAKKQRKPNIVFILTDDLSKNLVPYMSSVRALKRNGTTFTNHFAADALCCPSRANILTGKYPHNTGVRVNEGDRAISGGFAAFVKKGNQKRTYAVELNRAGYRTGFMGKYLNGYKIAKHNVPRGWDEWHVSGNGYNNIAGSYNITRVITKKDRKRPASTITKPKVYLNDLFGNRGKAFINRAKARNEPFFLQVNSFAPHQRVDGHRPNPPKNALKFPPKMEDRPGHQYRNGDCGTKPGGGRHNCKDLHVKRGDKGLNYKKLDKWHRDRVRMVQSLNDSIIDIRNHLKKTGQLKNTYFVFSADNGYHLGEHGLSHGKGTAYDHDVNIPLIVKGPGVKQGQVRHEITQTIDFYPTFQHMAGLKPKPSNGHSVLKLLRGGHMKHWRHAALVEHKPQQQKAKGRQHAAGIGQNGDPDLDGGVTSARRGGFDPAFTAYNALRSKGWLYVNYTNSQRGSELYKLSNDKGQNNNVIARYPKKAKKLSNWLSVYTKCGKQSKPTCWKAGHARFQNPGER